MTTTLAKWTIDDYHKMIDAGILNDRQVELLNGEIVEMSPEGIPHAFYSDGAADYLRTLLGHRAKIREGKPITLPLTNSEPEPDVAIVQPLGDIYLEHHPYPENIFWLIEFSNTSLSKDMDVKSKTYAESGVREHWVVNLRQRQLIVFHTPKEGKYQSQTVVMGNTVTSQAFSDIIVQVDRLLGKVR